MPGPCSRARVRASAQQRARDQPVAATAGHDSGTPHGAGTARWRVKAQRHHTRLRGKTGCVSDEAHGQ